MTVYVAHKLFQSLSGMEHLLTGVSLLVGAQVGQRDGDAGVEEGQLAHAAGNDVPLEGGGGKYRCIGPELLAGASQLGLTDHLYRVERFSLSVFLLIDFPVAEHL